MSRRVSHERLQWLGENLTPKDREVVAMLARLRLASGLQLRRVLWPDEGEATDRAARRTLERLTRWRVVARLERQVGGPAFGSRSWTYALDTGGQRVVAAGDLTGVRRPHLPRPAMWAHALATSEAYVRLVEHLRGSEVTLARWDGEPAAWRTFAGPLGETLRVKPDSFVETRGPGYSDLWMLETDTGSQSRTVLRAKLDAYVRYAASGQEQREHGVFPRVAFLTASSERVDLIAGLLRARPKHEWPLFAVARTEDAGHLLAGDWSDE